MAGCGRVAFDPLGAPATRSIVLHLDQTVVQEPLIDFPLLVQLTEPYLDRGALRTDARDLQFILDGQPLAYQIEDAGEPGEPVTAWVKVPTIIGGDTEIRLDYGSGEIAAESSGRVWTASYEAVFHLAEVSGRARDATGHYPDASIAEAGEPGPSPVPGRISRGRAFDSARSNAIQIDARELLYSPFTVSGWLYETTLPAGYHALVSRELFGAGENVFWIGDFNRGYQGELMRETGAKFLRAPASAAPDRWVHIALTAATSAASLFIDGQQVVIDTIDGPPPPGDEKPINLGADNNSDAALPGDDLLDGRLDEVRIETVARSAEWIRIDYLSMTGQLIRYEFAPE